MIHLDVQTKPLIDSSKLSAWERMKLLLRLQRYLLPYWDKALLRIVATLMMTLMAVIPTVLTARLIDEVFTTKDTGLLVQIVALVLSAFILIQILSFIAGAGTGGRWDIVVVPSNVMAAYMVPRIALDLKVRFYEHVQKLSMSFYSGRPIGEHMFRSTTDVDDAAFLVSEVIPSAISAVQRVVIMLLVLQGFAGWLTLPIVLYLVIFFCLKHAVATAVRRWGRRYRSESQRLDSVCREVLYPWKLVKGYTLQQTVRRWYGSQACRFVRAYFARNIFAVYDFYLTLVSPNTLLAVLSVFTGWSVLKGNMSLGEYTAVGGLVYQIVSPFQEAISTFQLIRQKLVPAERMLETLDVRPDLIDRPSAIDWSTPRGKVEVRGVSFAYRDGIPVLEDVSLVAHPGEKVALVGPTGAGKSTLAGLLVRSYDPQAGQLLMDGIDYREIRQASLRQRMAIVMQDIVTFTESIAENIRYGRPTASWDEVVRAAQIACVDEYALKLPEGYHTVLSEGGSLSGGQKQRLCLARALIRDPRVLILDEATSALDPVTEKQVVENIDAAFADRTRIVVAHNVFNARTADRIYVLDRGRVVASGTHEELMRCSLVYRSLWTGEGQSAA